MSKYADFRVGVAQGLVNAVCEFGIRGIARELLCIDELAANQVPAVSCDNLQKAVINAREMSGKYGFWKAQWALESGGRNPYVYVPTFEIALNPMICMNDPLEISVWNMVSFLEKEEDLYLSKLLDFAVEHSLQTARGNLSSHVLRDWSRNIRSYGGGILDTEMCPVYALMSKKTSEENFAVVASLEIDGDISGVLLSDGIDEDHVYVVVGGGNLGNLLVSQDVTILPVIPKVETDDLPEEVEMIVYEEIGMCLMRPDSVYRFKIEDL